MKQNFHSIEKNLPLLLPCFSENTTFQEEIEAIGEFLACVMPITAIALIRFGGEGDTEGGWWPKSEDLGRAMSSGLHKNSMRILKLADESGIVDNPELGELLGVKTEMKVVAHTIYQGKTPYGLLAMCHSENLWETDDYLLLGTVCSMLGATFAARISVENEERSSFVFNTIMDGMKASIYITNIHTNQILFMNKTMKEDFGLPHPEGKICYEVLQKGMKNRCNFCPVKQLLESEEERPYIQWDELNTVTGRSYRNYDSLIKWMDGSLVHLQQSIDVTEIKMANTDELTQLLSRRPGKTALQETLEKAKEMNQIITVCFYDVNNLKEVNDQFGHREGDRLISDIAWAIRGILTEGEYAFRMSGDEFVVVFQSTQKNAQWRLTAVQNRLSTLRGEYEAGFCFGLTEVLPDKPISAEEALTLSDERMYEQKRIFHIRRNEKRLKETLQPKTREVFEYDKERLYNALAQSTESYPYICNMKTGVFRYAPAMVEEFDLPSEIIENAAAVWGDKVHPNDKAAFLEANQEISDRRAVSHCVEYRALNRKGEWVWVRCRGHVEMDEENEPTLFAGFITNLGQKNKIDYLTGLFNKLEFEENIRYMIEKNPSENIGFMILGIDDLKHINDLYDRTFGDEVIRITAQKLQTLLPAEAALYRLDGDEFGIIIHNCMDESMQKLYRAINYSFENQQEYDGKKFYCTLSGGTVRYPQDATDFLNIIKYAEYALEYAKKHGKKCCVAYSTGILDHRSRALEMVEALRASVENDFEGFSIRFQPLVEATTKELLGAEVLARWQCKRFGEVSPIEFIPLLEQTGMILPMGKWVLKEAVKECKPWIDVIPQFVLNVNLSYLQIKGTDFLPFLKQLLRTNKFKPQNLVLELTESHFIQQNSHIQNIFTELRKQGVRIAVDDFGTGYSTLNMLKKIPADIVKIDRTFIRDIRTSSFDATFIRFVVELCHDVGIYVCLEGVETDEEYEVVNKMGLDMIQGYLFGRPMTAELFKNQFVS